MSAIAKKVITAPVVDDAAVRFSWLPLSSLVLSEKNVRKVTATAIESLAESILVMGLKQNLVVIPTQPVHDSALYGVTAGKRRYMALCLLRDRGSISADYPVRVLIEEPEQATLTSLTENIHREPMHPVDAFKAFSQLSDEGFSVAEIALKFGIPESLVKQRLALGKAAPELLDEFENGHMNLEQLMVLCQIEDLDRQKEIWFTTPEGWKRNASELRKLVSNDAIPLSSKLVKFVGLEVYEAEGGTVQRDLFDEDDHHSYICDTGLLKRLVDKKFKRLESELKAAGWDWVVYSVDYDEDATKDCTRFYPQARQMTEEETITYNEWDDRRDELAIFLQDYEDQDDLPASVLEKVAEYDSLIEKMNAFDKSLLEWGDIKASAGVYLRIDQKGGTVSDEGLIRKEDMKRVKGTDESITDSNKTEKQTDAISNSLQTNLACVRTSALQVELVKSPDVASVLMVHSLALSTFYNRWAKGFLDVSLTLNTDTLKSNITVFENTPAGEFLGSIHAKWQSRIPGDPSDLLDFLFKLEGNELQELFAYCAGQTLNTFQTSHHAYTQFSKLGEVLQLSMTNYWKPTKDNYFSRLKKSQIFTVLKGAGVDMGGLEEGMKKDLIAAQAEERIKAAPDWLPEQLGV